MVLPLLSTGFKIFQATRKKASSGSKVASNITTKKTSVTGKSVGVNKPSSIVKSGSNKISGAKFLQTTSDPARDKATSKGGILQAFASIINIINKFLSNILSTLIGDNKLTKKQADDQGKKDQLDLKRQRENKLEGGGESNFVSGISKVIGKSGSWLDGIINFISTIVLGTLILTLYKNFTQIIKFFKDTYETIKSFFKRLGEYISPLWNIFSWVASKFLNIFSKVQPADDEEYAKRIPKEIDKIQKQADDLDKQAGTTADEMDDVGEQEAKAESDDDINAVNQFKNLLSFMGNMALGSPAVAGTLEGQPMREDRPFAMEMIKEHEGLRLDKYLDSKGLPTIGYGHLIDESDPDLMDMPLGETISQERADELFERDFNEHLFAAQKIPGFFKASKRQQAALIDLTFNMGPNWYKGFPSFTKAFAAGDYEEAARQLEFADPDNRPGVPSGYVQDVGRRSDPILKLIQDKKLNDDSHLKSIENLLGQQSSANEKLANSIASISQTVDEDDSPIIVPVPQQELAANTGGSSKMTLIPIGGGVNSIDTLESVSLAKV